MDVPPEWAVQQTFCKDVPPEWADQQTFCMDVPPEWADQQTFSMNVPAEKQNHDVHELLFLSPSNLSLNRCVDAST